MAISHAFRNGLLFAVVVMACFGAALGELPSGLGRVGCGLRRSCCSMLSCGSKVLHSLCCCTSLSPLMMHRLHHGRADCFVCCGIRALYASLQGSCFCEHTHVQ